MNEWRVVDERTTDVPYLQYIFNMWKVCSDVSIQKAPLTAALSPFMSLLYPPNPWCEWCDVWRLTTTPGSTSPTLFQQWCGFFYVLQEPNKCKCCENLRFFVLIREVRTRDFPLSRPALFQLSQPGGSKWRQTAVMFTPYRIKSFLVQYEQQRHRTGTSRSRTSNVVPYRLTERVRWTKSSISHKYIQTTTINENRSLISSIKINKNR